MSDAAADNPEPETTSDGAPESTVNQPLTFGAPAEQKRYQAQFRMVYITLGLLLVGASVGVVVLASRPGPKPTPMWSNWAPIPGTVAKMSSQIADHVSHSYRLSKTGEQLVAVVPSKPVVTSGTTDVSIKVIAVRKKPNNNTGMEILYSTKTEMFTFCGLGTHCSILKGKATAIRGRIVRREALEVALYTFKFVPSIDSVIAFMPPAPGATSSPLVFLRKADLTNALKEPLRTTLSRVTPPLPTDSDLKEAATIDQLTLANTFSYQLQPLQTGGAALVLDPTQT